MKGKKEEERKEYREILLQDGNNRRPCMVPMRTAPRCKANVSHAVDPSSVWTRAGRSASV